MGKAMDVYKAYYDLAWSNPPSSEIEAQETYFADDFVSLDKDGKVEMTREAYAGTGQLLFSAFADMRYLYSDMREEGDTVIVTGHFEGTHTGDLDLSALGLGVIPASGKRVVWPDSTIRFRVVGDKIVSVQAVDDTGGMAAFMAALGLTPSSA